MFVAILVTVVVALVIPGVLMGEAPVTSARE